MSTWLFGRIFWLIKSVFACTEATYSILMAALAMSVVFHSTCLYTQTQSRLGGRTLLSSWSRSSRFTFLLPSSVGLYLMDSQSVSRSTYYSKPSPSAEGRCHGMLFSKSDNGLMDSSALSLRIFVVFMDDHVPRLSNKTVHPRNHTANS